MENENLFREYPSPIKGEAEYFVLLSDLDDAKHKYKKSKIDGSSEIDKNDNYKTIQKLEKQVKRDYAKLGGESQRRVRDYSSLAYCVAAYLELYPDGSATVKRGSTISFLSWAKRHKEKPFVDFEISEVDLSGSINLVDYAGNITTPSLKTIKNQISKQKSSNN